MRRTIGTLAPGLALVAALSACGGDPAPRFEAEPSAEPTTASPSASAEPEPWEERTDDGAVAFVAHWVAEFNKMRATGDTSELLKLSTDRCETCTNFVEYTDQIFSSGGSLETEGWSLISVSQPAEENSDRPIISMRVDQAPQVLRESGTAEPEKFTGGKANFVAHLRWGDGRWLMHRLDAA